jgi:hypothetical protein
MSSLPWLNEPLQRVMDQHQSGRLPHALLIRAAEGWGESAFANQLALWLIDRPEVEDARLLAHPDLHWVQPEGSVIKVDDIRALAGFAIGTRQIAPCKVAVIEAAESMNLNAANALLKTLEEPPADTYLLLTTSRPARLPATIVSRCQSVTIKRDLPAARDWLLSQWPAGEIEEKLFECGDAPLAVQSALAGEEPDLSGVLADLATKTPIAGEVAGLLEWDVDRLTSGWYRHCVALLAGLSRVRGFDEYDRAALNQFVDELQAVRHQLLSTNSANQRLLYERLAARWQGVIGSPRRRTG